MVSTKNIVIGLASVVGMIQMAPAPPAIVAAVIGGVAGGAVGGAATLCSRFCPGPRVRSFAGRFAQRDLPPGVSQHAIDECTQQINDQKSKGITVQISSNSEDSVHVTSVPPACMNLATVLSGNPAQAGGPVPIPTGSDSLRYTNMSVDERKNLAAALGA